MTSAEEPLQLVFSPAKVRALDRNPLEKAEKRATKWRNCYDKAATENAALRVDVIALEEEVDLLEEEIDELKAKLATYESEVVR